MEIERLFYPALCGLFPVRVVVRSGVDDATV